MANIPNLGKWQKGGQWGKVIGPGYGIDGGHQVAMAQLSDIDLVMQVYFDGF